MKRKVDVSSLREEITFEPQGGNFLWSWEKPPKAGWEIDWEGYNLIDL